MAEVNGSGRHGWNQGVHNPNVKLRWFEVKQIRMFLALGRKPDELAKKFGITASNVSRIKLRSVWDYSDDDAAVRE